MGKAVRAPRAGPRCGWRDREGALGVGGAGELLPLYWAGDDGVWSWWLVVVVRLKDEGPGLGRDRAVSDVAIYDVQLAAGGIL